MCFTINFSTWFEEFDHVVFNATFISGRQRMRCVWAAKSAEKIGCENLISIREDEIEENFDQVSVKGKG